MDESKGKQGEPGHDAVGPVGGAGGQGGQGGLGSEIGGPGGQGGEGGSVGNGNAIIEALKVELINATSSIKAHAEGIQQRATDLERRVSALEDESQASSE